MRFSTSVLLLAATGLAAQVSGASIPAAMDVARSVEDPVAMRDINHRRRHQRRQNNNKAAAANNGGANPTCLAANAVQTGSAATGQTGVVTAGQVASKTDAANFINFCAGQTLTNGLQTLGGSCNGVVMGKIPSKTNMVSSLITFPQPGSVVAPLTTFNVDVQTRGLAAGAFTNAQSTYYSAPQDLNGQGQIIGHTHVTIQDMGNSLTPKGTLDPTTFAFFKGINDAGNGQGLLSAVVTGGLPAGFYRVCTMSSSANHQPVLMPVAQRGAQDDCTKFEVRAGGTATNTGGNNANTGGNNANTGKNANTGNNANTGGKAAASTAPAAAATSAATGNGSGTGGKKNTGTGSAATAVAGNAKAASSKAATATAAPATGGGATGGTAIAIKSGTLGGAAPAVVNSGVAGRPFSVNGNTFVNSAAAVQRSCDIQFNACADAVNGQRLPGKTLNDCNTQKSQCGQ